jgi:hypothetical protein
MAQAKAWAPEFIDFEQESWYFPRKPEEITAETIDWRSYEFGGAGVCFVAGPYLPNQGSR